MKRRLRKAASISASRWATYALAGLGTGHGFVATSEAEIHYAHVNRLLGSTSHVDLSLTGGYSLVFHGSGLSYADVSVSPSLNGGIATDTRARSSRVAQNLRRGVNVSTRRAFRPLAILDQVSESSGEFLDPGTGAVAFKFNAGQGEQYGWVRLRTFIVAGLPRIGIIDYAWADPGEAIRTGQRNEDGAPEPGVSNEESVAADMSSGSLGLLALGSIGLMAWRPNSGRCPLAH